VYFGLYAQSEIAPKNLQKKILRCRSNKTRTGSQCDTFVNAAPYYRSTKASMVAKPIRPNITKAMNRKHTIPPLTAPENLQKPKSISCSKNVPREKLRKKISRTQMCFW
jgi:hypothetical protein